MGKKLDETRCAVCGVAIEGDEVVYRIALGTLGLKKPTRWTEKNVWGHAHKPCFAQAVESPDAVIAEMRRQSRK